MKQRNWIGYLVVVLIIASVFWPIFFLTKENPSAIQPKITPFPRTVWVKAYSVAGSDEKQWVLTLEWDFSDLDSATAFCESLIGWTP